MESTKALVASGTSPAVRLLFVFDYDYGALGLVMYLLYRQPLAARAMLLLPRRAYELRQGQLPVASRPYESLQDILEIVEAESPEAVCLFSGYLFARQGALSIRSLRTLIRRLRQRGCKVATSDPYLGTFAEIANAHVFVRTGAFHRSLERCLHKLPRLYGLVARLVELYSKKRLERHVRSVLEILKEVTHLYPVPMNKIGTGGVEPLSFFNPLYIRSLDELGRISARVSALPGADGRRRWLFVLAQFDLEFQEKKYGKQGFVDLVVSKIRESLACGKQPTFIGPAAITEALSRHFSPDSGVSLVPRCSFEEFELRLLEAEIVFYWQIFSTSAFLRLWNGLPVFFFDQGHSAHLSRPMHEAGLKYYYLAAPPIYLDIESSLDAATLTRLGTAFRESARDTCQRLAHLPTPEQMVSAIMGAG